MFELGYHLWDIVYADTTEGLRLYRSTPLLS